jgi:hypothetical protein
LEHILQIRVHDLASEGRLSYPTQTLGSKRSAVKVVPLLRSPTSVVMATTY